MTPPQLHRRVMTHSLTQQICLSLQVRFVVFCPWKRSVHQCQGISHPLDQTPLIQPFLQSENKTKIGRIVFLSSSWIFHEAFNLIIKLGLVPSMSLFLSKLISLFFFLGRNNSWFIKKLLLDFGIKAVYLVAETLLFPDPHINSLYCLPLISYNFSPENLVLNQISFNWCFHQCIAR